MIIILQDRGKKHKTAPCHLQDCDMMCRGSVCRGLSEKWWIGAVLRVQPYELLFFSSCLGARLLSRTHPQHHIRLVDSKNFQPEGRHFY